MRPVWGIRHRVAFGHVSISSSKVFDSIDWSSFFKDLQDYGTPKTNSQPWSNNNEENYGTLFPWLLAEESWGGRNLTYNQFKIVQHFQQVHFLLWVPNPMSFFNKISSLGYECLSTILDIRILRGLALTMSLQESPWSSQSDIKRHKVTGKQWRDLT